MMTLKEIMTPMMESIQMAVIGKFVLVVVKTVKIRHLVIFHPDVDKEANYFSPGFLKATYLA